LTSLVTNGSQYGFIQAGTFLDHNLDEIPYSEFINKELICFSMADNIRSIPCVADGLKPGQRKVIWSCFKRKLKKEIKVRLPLLSRTMALFFFL
jgi:DNA topoisomerase-2